jgi:HK97 family phage prohead protease
MNRALVRFEIKALDEDKRLIEGWATTPEVDRVGDIVMPKGAEYELPIPFLLDHDHAQVVGEVDRVEVSDNGIKFWAHIKKIAEEGDAKSLCDKAWSYIKHGLRKAVSIGFRPLDFDVLPSGGLKFTSWEWYELSAVGIPAQPSARILGTKSYSLGDTFVAEDPEPPLAIVGTRGPEIITELPPPPAAAASGKALPVVKLDDEVCVQTKPFVIKRVRTG